MVILSLRSLRVSYKRRVKMLMVYGDVTQIKDKEWYLLELRSERTLGPSLKRLGKHLITHFDEKPVEVFIPIHRRDHENFELLSDCYVFIHSDAYEKVRSLRSVVGVAALLANETNRKLIKVEDSYVRELIEEARDRFNLSRSQVHEGSFVRILDGESRDYCGLVLSMDNSRAQVKIILKGRVLLVDTPLGNLLDLGEVPESLRVYYYCEAINTYITEAETQEEMLSRLVELKKDRIEESIINRNTEILSHLSSKNIKKHRSRYETATALVRRLVLAGEKDMIRLARITLDSIKSDEIKRPKTEHIIYSIIKRNMVDVVYKDDPKVKTFRDVLRKNPGEFSLEFIKKEAEQRGIKF
jgi:transcription antitermination factor NusG